MVVSGKSSLDGSRETRCLPGRRAGIAGEARLGTTLAIGGRGPPYGMSAATGFGGRWALTAYVSWDGSDRTAHTPEDTFEAIELRKPEQVGQTTLLALTVLSREVAH